MKIILPIRSPKDRLDYDFTATRFLAGDALVAATAEADLGVTAETEIEGDVVKVWLYGGRPGKGFVRLLVSTAVGRVKEFPIELTVKS